MKYKVGDRVYFTPTNSDTKWPGTIVEDEDGDFPCLIREKYWYMVQFDNSRINQPLPEAESTLTLIDEQN